MSDQVALSLILLASGAAGLAFEMVWFYQCSLVFGSTVRATSVVLASFMGGLALGNFIVGRWASRVSRPLRLYAVVECLTAVSGVGLTLALPALTRANVLLTAFAVLLVPTTAMGATLPLLVGVASRGAQKFGTVLGRLYGWNTVGAVCGLVGAELVLIDRYGVIGTAWAAGLLDTGAAAAAWWLSRSRLERSRGPGRPDRMGGPWASGTLSRSVGSRTGGAAVWPILAGAWLAGGNLLALEVIWFRFVSMYVLTTTLALSLMLAGVLAAIALGGLSASVWLSRSPRAIDSLPAVALAGGCSVVVSYDAFRWLTTGTQVGDWSRTLWFVGVLAFPTAILSGILFTWLGEALRARIDGTSAGDRPATAPATRATAWLVCANTAGAMCGPLVAEFLLLPRLGMEDSFLALAATYGVVGIVLTLAKPRPVRAGVVVAAAALIVALLAFPFGLMRDRYFPRSAAAYAADGSVIVATREGPSETIFLMQQRWLGQPVYSRLVTNGFSMSGTAIPALRYMRYFVYLPMLIHETPLRHVLVVCYGVGATAGAATDVASVESIDVVETSRDIVAMSDLIYTADRHPLHDPRVRLHYEDGRRFLETTTERFDLITGEPPPPRTPGAVSIYTREYFQLIHDHLSDGGITTYWLPIGRPNPGTDVNTILRGFCDVFEDCSLWNATPFDVMIVGTRHAAGPVSETRFAEAWKARGLATRLREIGFESPTQIGATFIGDARRARELTASTPPLTDDYPQRLRPDPARPSLSDPRYGTDQGVTDQYRRFIDPARGREAFLSSDFIRRVFPAQLIRDTLPLFEEQRIINRVLWEGGKPLAAIDDLDVVLTRTSLQALPLWMLGSDHAKQQIGLSTDDGTGVIEYVRGVDALVARDYLGAAESFLRAERRGFHSPTVRPLLVYALCRGGRLSAAAALAQGIGAHDADATHFWSWLRRTFDLEQTAPGGSPRP